ncbi:MAG: carbon-nitrogen hydrolase family protein [Kiritimatiellae bacterium]|nr:carbon-nitrogen hydrolase family protein [Kiritimatiellia bacterium]
MKLALVQMECSWGRIRENLQRMLCYIEQSVQSGATLVVFPEMSVPGMWKDHMVRLFAEPVHGSIVQEVRRWARRFGVAVAFGLAERSNGKPYNSFVLVNRQGSLVGVYRKNHVTILERDYFRRGKARPVFCLEGMRVGIGICADCAHEDFLDAYGRRGVALMLMPHAWDADPILRGGRVARWRSMAHMVAAHATGQVHRYRTHDEMLSAFVKRLSPAVVRNGFYAAFVNQVGCPHPLMPFVGPSFLLDPEGNIVVRSKNAAETVLVAEVPSISQ